MSRCEARDLRSSSRPQASGARLRHRPGRASRPTNSSASMPGHASADGQGQFLSNCRAKYGGNAFDNLPKYSRRVPELRPCCACASSHFPSLRSLAGSTCAARAPKRIAPSNLQVRSVALLRKYPKKTQRRQKQRAHANRSEPLRPTRSYLYAPHVGPIITAPIAGDKTAGRAHHNAHAHAR